MREKKCRGKNRWKTEKEERVKAVTMIGRSDDSIDKMRNGSELQTKRRQKWNFWAIVCLRLRWNSRPTRLLVGYGDGKNHDGGSRWHLSAVVCAHAHIAFISAFVMNWVRPRMNARKKNRCKRTVIEAEEMFIKVFESIVCRTFTISVDVRAQCAAHCRALFAVRAYVPQSNVSANGAVKYVRILIPSLHIRRRSSAGKEKNVSILSARIIECQRSKSDKFDYTIAELRWNVVSSSLLVVTHPCYSLITTWRWFDVARLIQIISWGSTAHGIRRTEMLERDQNHLNS